MHSVPLPLCCQRTRACDRRSCVRVILRQVAKEIWEVASGSVKKIDVDIATYEAAALPH